MKTLLIAMSIWPSLNGIGRDLNLLMGHPASDAFEAMGYPDSKDSYGDDTVYKWGSDREASCLVKLVAGPSGKLKSWNVLGSPAGCKPYEAALKRWLKGHGS